jgi:hypothetical protein
MRVAILHTGAVHNHLALESGLQALCAGISLGDFVDAKVAVE